MAGCAAGSAPMPACSRRGSGDAANQSNGVRCNHEGHPLSLVDGLVTGVQADPVEKKPLYHFLPGSRTFSVGSAGCNFSCRFCQNHHISRDPLEQERIRGHEATPEMLVEAALRTACRSLAFIIN